MQFQNQRLVMLQTDVYCTADLYHAKRPDKPRIIWHYRINMLLFIFHACTWVYTVCLHLEQVFETVLEEMKLDTDVLEETFAFNITLIGLVLSIQYCLHE